MRLVLKIFILFALILGTISVSFSQESNLPSKADIIALYNSNKLQDAYELISQIPEENRDAELWLLLANITQDYGKDIDSVFLLRKAISVDPGYYKAYYNLGNVYFKDGKTLKAIENYELTLKYNRNFHPAYYNLGCCYFNDKQYGKAKSNFLKAIKLKGTEPNYYYNLALTYKQMNNKKQAQKTLDIYDNLSKN